MVKLCRMVASPILGEDVPLFWQDSVSPLNSSVAGWLQSRRPMESNTMGFAEKLRPLDLAPSGGRCSVRLTVHWRAGQAGHVAVDVRLLDHVDLNGPKCCPGHFEEFPWTPELPLKWNQSDRDFQENAVDLEVNRHFLPNIRSGWNGSMIPKTARKRGSYNLWHMIKIGQSIVMGFILISPHDFSGVTFIAAYHPSNVIKRRSAPQIHWNFGLVVPSFGSGISILPCLSTGG